MWNRVISIAHQTLLGGERAEGARGMLLVRERWKMHIIIWSESLKGRGLFEEVGVDGRKILVLS
jgi:hypothetical protein